MRWHLTLLAAFLGWCLTGLAAAEELSPREAKKLEYQRPAEIPFPEESPYEPAKADLGKLLFFDPIFSGSGSTSCASCHNPGLSWGDGLARAIGDNGKTLALRTPTLLNIAWIPVLGWDGKFPDLESVAFTPITAPGNMNRKEEDLVAALQSIPGYRDAFAKAYPDAAVTRVHIEDALATYERTIISGEAPFDRWIKGDETAIGEDAKRGFDLFVGKAQCAECHGGWNFTGGAFYDIGHAKEEDIGRGKIFANSPKLMHAFKVPTLRDVVRRAPYMHDGSVLTLDDVIELYDRGGIDRPSRSELIKPLGLSDQEKRELVSFLKTLTSPPQTTDLPYLPR